VNADHAVPLPLTAQLRLEHVLVKAISILLPS